MLSVLFDVRRRDPARVALIGACLLGAALLIGGCASSKSPAYAPVGARAAIPAPVPVRIEVEDDGLPAQSPPQRRVSAEPDDPSEPFSRNYGSRKPAVPAAQASTRPAQRATSAPVTTVGYDSTFDADGVIAQAIAAHEARVQ